MPRNNSSEPPPVMTWGKALPVLAVSGVFDALKFMFELFWFFAPALIGVGSAVAIGGTAGKLIGVLGAGSAVVASPVLEIFGLVMAMAVAFLGWLLVGFWILAKNRRIFKVSVTGSLWLMSSLGIGLVPFVGAIPAMTITIYRLYRRQIKVERAAFKRWEQETAAAREQEQQQRALQVQQAQQMQAAQMEAANDAQYEMQAANDEQYSDVPEEEQLAA